VRLISGEHLAILVSVELKRELIVLLVYDSNVGETLSQLIEAEHTCESQSYTKTGASSKGAARGEPSKQRRARGKKRASEKE
jgi:hypothetical protein